MPFTSEELAQIDVSSLEFFFGRGQVFEQAVQDKPLLRLLLAGKKEFPGGKDYISFRVKGLYTGGFVGFEGDDQLTFVNPTNVVRAAAAWKELHSGQSYTRSELLHNGIGVEDTLTGEGAGAVTGAEKVQLFDLMKDKNEEMAESNAKSLNLMLWKDGAQDPKEIPGLTSFIVDDPTASVQVLGINQGTNTWWRNRARVGGNKIAQGSDPNAQILINTLNADVRQLRRYGGKPSKALAGSDFLEWLEKEAKAKGFFTMSGWKNKTEVGIGDVELKGITFEYDPTLDDLGWSKRCYILDPSKLVYSPMRGQHMKKHKVAREHDRLVFYRSITETAGFFTHQRNAHEVVEIT